MNEREVGQLLSVLATIDPKLPAAADAALLRRIWTGLLHDVPAEAAQRAVEHYYRSERYLQTREPLSPANIVQHWNAHRRPTQREQRGHPIGQQQRLLEPPRDTPPASTAHIRHTMTELCAQLGWAPTYSVALTVVCPDCAAPAGQPCTSTTVHDARREAARHLRKDTPR